MASDSQTGFASDFNVLFASGTGKIGLWQGIARPTLAAWRSADFTDQHSLAQNPQFVNPAGSDTVMGYSAAPVGSAQIIDNGAFGDTALHIGRYKILDDTAGIPPEVSLTAPADGSSAPERNPLVVRASATDDIQVASVQFLIDGVSVAEVFKAPYQATVRVPAGVPSFKLTAVATDLGGNHSESDPVVVTVIPDDKPQVSFLAMLATGWTPIYPCHVSPARAGASGNSRPQIAASAFTRSTTAGGAGL